MGAREIINEMKLAVEQNNRKRMLYLMSPDIQPNWDETKDKIFEEWDQISDQANDILYS